MQALRINELGFIIKQRRNKCNLQQRQHVHTAHPTDQKLEIRAAQAPCSHQDINKRILIIHR